MKAHVKTNECTCKHVSSSLWLPTLSYLASTTHMGTYKLMHMHINTHIGEHKWNHPTGGLPQNSMHCFLKNTFFLPISFYFTQYLTFHLLFLLKGNVHVVLLYPFGISSVYWHLFTLIVTVNTFIFPNHLGQLR